MKNIFISCPNMVNSIKPLLKKYPDIKFTLWENDNISEEEIIKIIHMYDGWITGDDPVTRNVLLAGKKGKLKIVVKWGVGTDSVDKKACEDLCIDFFNTPNMFGDEVADSAISYLLCMARNTHIIDTLVRKSIWFRPSGKSLRGKNALIIGYGDVGKALGLRLIGFGVLYDIKDPYVNDNSTILSRKNISSLDNLKRYDYIFLCCPLNQDTYHMINLDTIKNMKKSVIIINVARGSLVKTNDIIFALKNNLIGGYATDVYEEEPPYNSELFHFSNVMLGSHNSSNTEEAVMRTNIKTIELVMETLKQSNN